MLPTVHGTLALGSATASAWLQRSADEHTVECGVLTGGDCDLVGPLSTVAGLGTWGADLGLERLFGLPPATRAFVTNPLNYHRVQVTTTFVRSTWHTQSLASLSFLSGN
jgi:hypothetical protein